MLYYKPYNSPEQRKKRSDRASKAATERWRRYHESLKDEPVRGDLPEDLYRLTFENLITGKTEVLVFHPGSRKNNYRIDVNGKEWKVCGFNGALDRIGKSCYRIAAQD